MIFRVFDTSVHFLISDFKDVCVARSCWPRSWLSARSIRLGLALESSMNGVPRTVVRSAEWRV